MTLPSKGLSRAETDALADATATAIGLPIAAEFRPGVLANFETVARLAQIVMACPLGEDVEPAPVFNSDRLPA